MEFQQINCFNLIPLELLREILKLLSLKELIQMTILDTNMNKLIKQVKWNHMTIRVRNLERIKYVITTYKFKKYDFSYTDITDNEVKLLGACRTLNLSNCNKITDSSVKLLGGCNKLYLANCYQITDLSVKLLGTCHKLNLTYCKQITDSSVKLLGSCHQVYLNFCHQITDSSVKLLGGCHTLYLQGCYQITDAS